MESDAVPTLSHSAVKQCCADAYGSDVARLLLGELFHPGGTKTTERLGEILGLTPRSRVLDIAAGKGTSATFLANRFGCEIVGVDYSRSNVEEAVAAAAAKGLSQKVFFQWADAEQLPFPDDSFDAVICECAFCTFPNKHAAANEFVRVVRPGGAVGLSDLTREGVLASELDGLMGWIACIADAQPLSAYVELLSASNLKVRMAEAHNNVLNEFVNQIRTRLFAAEVMVGLRKLTLPGFDFEVAKALAKSTLEAIGEGKLGYAIFTATKSA